MDNGISRKGFLTKGLMMAGGLALAPSLLVASQAREINALPAELVNEFVKIAHSDFEQVKTMLKAEPLLLNAAWDWGGGDFETALGAAGHMGHKDIATHLLDRGARTDIFVLTMLGQTKIVKAMLTAFPALLNGAGPHGFTLLHHAEKGGKEAEALLAHLEKLGLKETHIPLPVK